MMTHTVRAEEATAKDLTMSTPHPLTSPQSGTPPLRNSARRSLTGLVLVAPLVLTACSNGYADPTGAELEGTDAQVSQIEIADLRLASRAEGEQARFLGTLGNQSDLPLEMTFRDDDDEVSVIVPADTILDLADTLTLFETADVQPGTIATVMISVASDEEATELPVIDGTVDQDGDIVPNDAEN